MFTLFTVYSTFFRRISRSFRFYGYGRSALNTLTKYVANCRMRKEKNKFESSSTAYFMPAFLTVFYLVRNHRLSYPLHTVANRLLHQGINFFLINYINFFNDVVVLAIKQASFQERL